MLTKLSNSWELVKASARVLQADKELMVFPAVSGLALLLVTASFFLPVYFLAGGFVPEAGVSILGYVLVFLFYVVQYFVIIFFNTALVGAAMIRLDGGDPTVADGLRIATQRLGSILGYAVIAATVGMLLRTMKERAGALGKFVISLVGMAWNLATFLVVPVLVARNVGPIDAVKESAAVLKRTWGEQIAGNFGLGAVFAVAFFGLTVLAVPTLILTIGTGQPWLIATVVGVFIACYVLLALVNASLAGIYSAALYRYATTGQTAMFDSRLLQGAFRPKG
ncbi:MAG: DUF6159 family protein [Acidobacteriota bacterium]